MEETQFIDISLEKERMYILNGVDAVVIKEPIVILYYESNIYIWDSEGMITFLDSGKITHNFVIK